MFLYHDYITLLKQETALKKKKVKFVSQLTETAHVTFWTLVFPYNTAAVLIYHG